MSRAGSPGCTASGRIIAALCIGHPKFKQKGLVRRQKQQAPKQQPQKKQAISGIDKILRQHHKQGQAKCALFKYFLRTQVCL